jgi:hypothetical protein
LTHASARDLAEAGIKAMQIEADKLVTVCCKGLLIISC